MAISIICPEYIMEIATPSLREWLAMTVKRLMYDAVVIGGGPAGNRVACLLAAKGHRVAVLERQAVPPEKCCTGIIGRECAETFDIKDNVILRRVSSASLISPSGNRLYLHRDETQAVVLDRAAFDASMRERAQRAGAEYHPGSRVTNVKIEPDRATVTVSSCDKEHQILSKSVVIACGFAPGLLGRLGLGRFRDFTYGAQAEVVTPGSDEVEVYFGNTAPGFFAWLVPVTPSLARAGLLSRGKPGEYLRKWLEYLKSNGKIASTDIKIRYGAIPLKPLSRTFGERILVVGDAAGQVKPTSGGGIYYGLLCADIAAETLHGALVDDDLSEKRLARYEKAWRRKIGRELRTGYWARKLFERMSYRQIDRLFEILKSGGIDEALLKSEDLSFDWHSRTIRQLLKYQIVTRTLKIARLPFGAGPR
ncbi:MAG: NAD(P)/FAD-dependent oxidoreductase [Dehalococcoidales bacterium]